VPIGFEFVKPQPKASTSMGGGFGAWLGTIPSYSQDEGGVLLSGVSAGSPAEKAGLRADDVLVRMGDVKIENVEDFTLALRARKPGDKVAVEVLRGGKSLGVRHHARTSLIRTSPCSAASLSSPTSMRTWKRCMPLPPTSRRTA
jgi:S1-C subfamily serine protease